MDYDSLKVTDDTQPAQKMVVQNLRAAGSTSLTVDGVLGVPAKFIATSGTPGADGLITKETKQDFYGHTNDISVAKTTPGTGANDTGIGTVDWVGPNNLSGGTAATCSPTTSVISHYLKQTNYGFALPTGAVITGIQLDIQVKVSANTISNHANDQDVQLVKANGTKTSASHSGFSYGTSYAINTYGGDGDLWGTTWGASDVNSANFGAALAASIHCSGAGAEIVSVLSMKITVFYVGNVLTISGFLPGSTDEGNSQNQIVLIKPNTHWANKVADFMGAAAGVSTPVDIHAATGSTAGDIVTTNLALTDTALLDGVTDPTYRHAITAPEFSAGVVFVSFLHGLPYIPRVRARWTSEANPQNYWPMPTQMISNSDYTGISVSGEVSVISVDAANINVAITFHDGIGLSIIDTNFHFWFQFFCTPFAVAI